MYSTKNKTILNSAALAAILLAQVTLSACGEDTPATDGGTDDASTPDPAESACALVAEAGTPITASATRDATTPELVVGAGPYLVSLPSAGTGYLRIQADLPGEALILFPAQAGVVTNLYDDADTAIGVVSAGPNPFCAPEIPEHFDVDLESAGAYYVEVTAGADVWLLVGDGEGHGD